MKVLIMVFLFGFCSLSAQQMDYNTKKGFVAHGYDVVAYFNNHAIEGDKKITWEFDGVNYKFSSQKNLDVFKTDPQKYIPQYGGYCAYAIAVKGKKVAIDPETFEIRNGKLYLFYNAWGTNTLELWNKENPENLLEIADENWKSLKNKQ